MMTDQERRTVLNVVRWCIDRIHEDRTRAMAEVDPTDHDYTVVLGDVVMKLDFLADWLRHSDGIPVYTDGQLTGFAPRRSEEEG